MQQSMLHDHCTSTVIADLKGQVALAGQSAVPVSGSIVHGDLAFCFLDIHNAQRGQEECNGVDG